MVVVTPAESLARARELDQPAFICLVEDPSGSSATGPLAGTTFAIKDNIDLAGVPTTAADPRVDTPAATSAPAVQRLVDAGAVAIGKTNLDQYATGLVGTRSPYGACHAVDSSDHVSGGSSSGSAVAVAAGVVDFALGTDTAGSGRVPAAFNGLVGVKPSRGLVPTRGTVPACASLDCVTVLTRSVGLARTVLDVMAGPDRDDPWSRRLVQALVPRRPVLAVPDVLPGLDAVHEKAWLASLERATDLGDTLVVDVSPLLEAAELLYSGPWLAERTLAFGDRLADDPAVDPTVRAIVTGAPPYDGPGVFAAFHRLAELARQAAPVWETADALLLPVTCTHPTLAEVGADPVGVNTRLGRFTNMTNLLDLCAVAVPGPERDDGLPFGVQLLAPAGHDLAVLDLAARWCGEEPVPAPGGNGGVRVAVAGAHLSGQPLNGDLVARGGRLVGTTRTAADYRMYVVDGPLPRPGLTRTAAGAVAGPGLEVEVWELPREGVGSLLESVLPPLAIGPLELADGTQVLGFVCTAEAVDPTRDITAHGGWRAWLAAASG
ncbi:MAG TPA: allophanate hydrolase [Nocardioides sp.]|nr:allophanate hydrolase [Nocardioides sp.]